MNGWEYLVSADLGQAHDYTAVIVLEVPLWADPSWPIGSVDVPGWVSPAGLNPDQRWGLRDHARGVGQPGKPPLLVRHIERVRGVRYTRIVERLGELMRSLPAYQAEAQLILDYGGVGRAVYDLAVQRGLDPAAVTVTGGDRINGAWPDVRVPKREVVASAQIALQEGRLRIAPDLDHAQTLVKELLAFRVRISASGHDSYAGREGVHDDLVMATAQAVWARDWYHVHHDAAIPTAVGGR